MKKPARDEERDGVNIHMHKHVRRTKKKKEMILEGREEGVRREYRRIVYAARYFLPFKMQGDRHR